MSATQEPAIPLVVHLSRLVDTFMYVADLLDAYSATQGRIIERHVTGVSALADEHGLLFQLPDEELEKAARSKFAQLLRESAEQKARAYTDWILNQGLVSLCTVFDVFLDALVDVVIRTRVEILYAAAGAKNIELKEIVELGSLEAVTDRFREKEVKRFGFLDIKDRFRYLESKLGLDVDDIFRFRRFTPEAQQALRDWDPDKVAGLYGSRHRIIHGDERPVKNIETLRELQDVLSKMMIDLAFQVKAKHGIELDLVQPLLQLRALLKIEEDPH